MAIETELKLRLTPEALTRLRRHALFKKHQFTAPVTHRLHNIYFDTPKLELHKRKMALRLRRVGGRWLQTLKGGGQVMAGLHQRLEWEVPVPSDRLDFSGLELWDEYLPQALRNELHPVFITDFYRTSRELNWQGAIIEACFDHGEVKTEQHSTPICELELELKSGEPQQLFALAQAILEIVSFQLETISKAEQGFRLLSGFVPQPVKSTLPETGKLDSLSEVLQMVIWACVAHFQGNLNGMMVGADCEYLHQLRVAIRRLRVVLLMAEKMRADDELAALRIILAELGSSLGRIREWDVFIAGNILPAQAIIEGELGQQSFNVLLAHCELQRADCYAVLREQSHEIQRLLLRLAHWMHGSYWQETSAISLNEFASHRLQRLARSYQKAAQELDALDMAQLHALRIKAKKLRYSAEFFAGLYPGKVTKPYLAALSEVQEQLGNLNDIRVAVRLLDEFVDRLSEHREIIAFIKTSTEANLPVLFKELHQAVKNFARQSAFWEK